MTTFWIMKQRERKLYIPEMILSIWDFIEPPGGDQEPRWRGPFEPDSAVKHVPAGAMIMVWDTEWKFVWEANVSAGVHRDDSIGRVFNWDKEAAWGPLDPYEKVIGPGLIMTRVGAYPCAVTQEEFQAIKGWEEQDSLDPLPASIGEALWDRITQAVASWYYDSEVRVARVIQPVGAMGGDEDWKGLYEKESDE